MTRRRSRSRKRCARCRRRWNPALLRAHAETFSEDVFIARFRSVLATALEQKKLGRLGADDAA